MPDILEYVMHAFIYLFYSRLGTTNQELCKLYEELFGIGNFSNNPTTGRWSWGYSVLLNWNRTKIMVCEWKISVRMDIHCSCL